MEEGTYTVGIRGCAGDTSRRGTLRKCGQLAVVEAADGKPYCYYHNPDDPKKFGEGRCYHGRGYCDRRYHTDEQVARERETSPQTAPVT